MLVCRHCRCTVTCDHYCHRFGGMVYMNDTGNFLTSMLIAEETGDPMLAALAGGSLSGAIVGEEIFESSMDYSDCSNDVW